jgi:protein required for attachment to host cells
MVLLLARLVNGSALRNAVIVATPNDLGSFREAEHALDGFPTYTVSRHRTFE